MTTTEKRAELLALAVRVEGGETGAEIDRLAMGAWFIASQQAIGIEEQDDNGIWRNVKSDVWLHPQTKALVSMGHLRLSTSIDAQAALPGRIEEIRWMDGKESYCVAETAISHGAAPTEPAARLAALLRAMAGNNPHAG